MSDDVVVPGPIAWVHVETDHLDTHNNVPLELAVIMTDPRDLSIELGVYQGVVSRHIPNPTGLSAEAWKRHIESGLLHDVRSKDAQTLGAIEADAVALVQRACEAYQAQRPAGVRALPATFGASRPSFHRQVVRRRLPALHKAIHHREIDVSTLREVMRRFMGITDVPKRASHRAIDGARAAIATMQRFVDVTKRRCRHPRVSGALDYYVCDSCGLVGTFSELRSGDRG